jgi:hypothetical protein
VTEERGLARQLGESLDRLDRLCEKAFLDEYVEEALT